MINNMAKIWLIARTTYRQRLRSGMFLLLTFGLPLLMLVAGAIPLLIVANGDVTNPIGVVDLSGGLTPVAEVEIVEEGLDIDQRLRFIPFDGEAAARRAYMAGEIGGYMVIPVRYFDGGSVTYFAAENPGAIVESGLERYLQRAQLAEASPWLLDRLQDPATYTYAGLTDGTAVTEGAGLIIRLLVPVVLAIIFALAVFLGAGQMGAAIIREKDSRAMEMVVTSLHPRDLVAGKVLGMTLLTLTQFAIWIAGALGAAALAFWGEIDPSGLAIPWRVVVWGSLLIIPAYFLYAFLAAGVGILAGDSQQAQQLAGLVGIFGLAPLWILGPILANPSGGLAVGLTLFPLTAPTVALVRMIFGAPPLWQLLASLALLLLALILAIWFVAKIFRAAMLRYGQPFRPREIWQVMTAA